MFKKTMLLLLLSHGLAMAQTVSGSVFCSGNVFDPSPASVAISGTVASDDVGLPGAIWIGIEDPATPGYPTAFLTPNGWVTWTTGGFPTYVETSAINQQFSYTACVPGSFAGGTCSATTGDYLGWKVYAGYGVLTPVHQSLITKRRASLDSAKTQLVAKGKWRTEYEDDVAYRNALIQGSANDGRWGEAMTIPFVDCSPPSGGN